MVMMVVDREVNEEVDQVSKEVKEEVPNLPRRGLVVGPAGTRPSIGNQFILRSSSGLSQPPLCTALPHPLHCTALLFLVLHNALYTMLFTPLKMFCTVLHLILCCTVGQFGSTVQC